MLLSFAHIIIFMALSAMPAAAQTRPRLRLGLQPLPKPGEAGRLARHLDQRSGADHSGLDYHSTCYRNRGQVRSVPRRMAVGQEAGQDPGRGVFPPQAPYVLLITLRRLLVLQKTQSLPNGLFDPMRIGLGGGLLGGRRPRD